MKILIYANNEHTENFRPKVQAVLKLRPSENMARPLLFRHRALRRGFFPFSNDHIFGFEKATKLKIAT